MSHDHGRAQLTLAAILALGAAGNPHLSQATQSSSATILSGDLYLYGNHVAPPYELVVRDGALAVNGLRVFPRLRPAVVRDLGIAEDTRQRHKLRERVLTLQGELERTGRTTEEITPQLTELLRTESALVDSVTGVRDDEFWIWWRGERQPERFLVRKTGDGTKPTTRAEEERDLLHHALERACLVIVTPNRQLIFPPDPPGRISEILEEIERAHQAAASELTAEQWRGHHFDHEVARLFHHPLELPAEE